MATYPLRKGGVKCVVDSLYKQCTRMIVCLNGYNEIPYEFPKYENVQYVLAGPGKSMEDLGCNNKMAWLGKFDGYYMTVDDDIIYPSDYCKTYVEHMKRFNNSVVMSYETRGYRIENGTPISLKISNADARSFSKGYNCYTLTHKVGGGVMCMYQRKLPFDYREYISKPKNFGDDEITTILC